MSATIEQKDQDVELGDLYNVMVLKTLARKIARQKDSSSETDQDTIEKIFEPLFPDSYRQSKVFFDRFDITNLIGYEKNSKDWIDPTYDPYEWSLVYEYNTRFGKCVRVRVNSIAGNGYSIKSDENVKKNQLNEKKFEKQKRKLDAAYSTLKQSNWQKILLDREVIGRGFIQSRRNRIGRIVSLSHKPSIDIRDASAREGIDPPYGYVQLNRETNSGPFLLGSVKSKTYYKKFGDPRSINRKTGELAKSSTPYEDLADELIELAIYAPGCTDFIPRVVSARHAIQGNYYIGIQNTSLLRNDATPRLCIAIENGNLSPASTEQIQSFFDQSGRGPENEGRVLIIQLDKKKPGLPNAAVSQSKIHITPLSMNVIDDASFQKFRASNNSEISEACDVPEMLAGGSELGKAASTIIEKNFHENVIRPDIVAINDIMNTTVTADLLSERLHLVISEPENIDPEKARYLNDMSMIAKFSKEEIEGYKRLTFENKCRVIEEKMASSDNDWILKDIDSSFETKQTTAVFENKIIALFSLNMPAITDELEQARVSRLYQDQGAIAPNKILRDMGEEPFNADEHPWAERPMVVNQMMLKAFVDPKFIFGQNVPIIQPLIQPGEQDNQNQEEPKNEPEK